jgi:hypothetical protein
MDFSPELIALVTFGLLLNAGMLEEVQQAWGRRLTWADEFPGGGGGLQRHGDCRPAQLSGHRSAAWGIWRRPLTLGGYGVLWAGMRISALDARRTIVAPAPGLSPHAAEQGAAAPATGRQRRGGRVGRPAGVRGPARAGGAGGQCA